MNPSVVSREAHLTWLPERRRRLAPAWLRPYLSAFQGQLRSATHFRTNLLAWSLESPLYLAVLLLLWRAVYAATDRVGGLGLQEMIGYVLVVYVLRRVFSSVETVNYEVWTEINRGRLDAFLVRPLHFGWFKLASALAAPVMELAMGLPFFIAASLVLGVAPQREPRLLAAFLLSAVLAFLTLFLVQFLIGTLTFWTERIFGFRDILYSVFMLFSGQLIPITALPEWARGISRFLPFSGIYFTPATLYAAPSFSSDAARLLVAQVLWLALLALLAWTSWSRGVGRYASQGG